MADLNINLFALLGIVELLLLVMLLSAVLFVRLRGSRRRVQQLQDQLRQAQTEVRREAPPPAPPLPPPQPDLPPQRDYADFLRDELAHSDLLLGEDIAAQAAGVSGDPAADADTALLRQMLAVRHQFLQLELDVQGVKSTADVQAQRRSIAMGMQALLDGLRAPQAATSAPTATDAAETAAPAMRSEVSRLEDQITHLRGVIDNQHSVMRELRQLLEDHGNDSEELQEALRKLGDAEAQALELQRCLEVMDCENERLKAKTTVETGGRGVLAAGPDADMLRDLVGSQQRTISKLQHMLQSLAPDSGKAKELGDAIGKIQRANSELNSCVMVLEDENAMLRGQVETLQERIADLEANASPPRPPPQTVTTDPLADIDALLEDALMATPAASVNRAGTPAAAPIEAMSTAPATDEAPLDTDDLLAELFGHPGGTATGKTG